MRKRDLRLARKQSEALSWSELERDLVNMPLSLADYIEPDPEGDVAWLDAMAGANSGTDELNRR